MTDHRSSDPIRYSRSALVPGAEMVTAERCNHSFPQRFHSTVLMVVMVVAGAVRIAYSDDSSYVLKAGSVVVIEPTEVYSAAPAGEEGWSYRAFGLPVELVFKVARNILGYREQSGPVFTTRIIQDDDDVYRRLTRAHRMLEAGDDSLAAQTALDDGLSTLLERYAIELKAEFEVVEPGTSDAPPIAKMIWRLTEDMAERVSLEEVAESAGWTKFHADRTFREEIGLSPFEWRTIVRLERSLALLEAGESLADVALSCGFTDQAHFTNNFKAVFGVPPGKWRAQLAAM